MKILILTDRFVPEVTAPSVRIMDHARVWIEEGHDVTVVTCAPNIPQGVVFEGYSNKLYQEEWIEGIRTIRVWSYMTANEGFVKRSLDYISYMTSAILQCHRFPEFDVLLATSPPLFTAVAGYLVSKLRRRPWVFEIRDLWPESIVAVGAMKGPWMIRFLEWLERRLYTAATWIVTVGNGYRDQLLERGVAPERITVIPSGVDCRVFEPREDVHLPLFEPAGA